MSKLNSELVDEIVRSCLDLYEKLPKNGKPVDSEWTVLSCVVQLDTGTSSHEVVAVGTGSKCIGASKMSPTGALLNDSHAEVCARRAFLLYLYDNIKYALADKPSILQRKGNRFCLKENIELIFYSSQLPCGDASIFPKSDKELVGDLLQSNKRPASEDVYGSECKKMKLDADIHRTGAKCLPESKQDPKLPGPDFHVLGQVRTKPGRGDRTLSVSCSDKLARWIHAGIQGALLHLLCGPIFIKYLIFGGGVPYSKESLIRALLYRKDNQTAKNREIMPELYQSSITFPHVRTEINVRPAPGSIIWLKTHESAEVAVQGKKLGLTKKQAGLSKYSLCISKYKLYERFLQILHENDQIKNEILKDCALNNIPYNEMKRKAIEYNDLWQKVKNEFFGSWTVKPDMWNFCVDIT
ncbi:adenosine-deaminase (editase) domain-containing protein [Phthorimaea operculella]|nr:adenosine-deaminase (editase) domain-containing protein [Phthorimaea operculella]